MTRLAKGHVGEAPDLKKKAESIDKDLEIMDRHSADLADVESEIQESMKKRDREHKDSNLHSTPKSLKHTRF